MYATVFKADPLDPARGQRYRERILRPGGSRDDLDSLKVYICSFLLTYAQVVDIPFQDFLGRPPNSEAFVKELFGAETEGQSNL